MFPTIFWNRNQSFILFLETIFKYNIFFHVKELQGAIVATVHYCKKNKWQKIVIFLVCVIEAIRCPECDYYMDENNCMFEKMMFLLVDGVAVYMDRLQFNMDGAYVCNLANSLGKPNLVKSSYGRLSTWLHHKIEKIKSVQFHNPQFSLFLFWLQKVQNL